MKVVFVLILLFCSLSIVQSGSSLAHSSSRNILVNNDFLLKEYRGAHSDLFDIPQHYIGNTFSQNETVNFKILFNKMNLNMPKYCKVMFDNQLIASRDYKIDYSGIDLFYEGVEFDITSEKSGSFMLEIDCFENKTNEKIYFEEIKLDFGPEITFPKVLVINDQEVEFGKTFEYDIANNDFLTIDFSKYNEEFSFEWDSKNITKNGFDSIQISTMELEDSDIIVAKITHTSTGLVNYGFIRLNRIEGNEKVEDNLDGQVDSIIFLVVAISSIALTVGFVVRKNYKYF